MERKVGTVKKKAGAASPGHRQVDTLHAKRALLTQSQPKSG